MTREIKFRFWDEDNNRFWNGGDEGESIGEECFQTFFENNCLVGAMGESIDVGFEKYDFRERQLPKSQYTGLKDSKGVEIYEGDIVKYRERNLEKAFGYEKGGDDYNHKVKLIEFRNQSFNVPGGFIKDLEVIGNRHENPELLEEQS